MKVLHGLLIALLLLIALFSLQQQPISPTPPRSVIEMVERKADYYLSKFSIDTLDVNGNLKHTLSGQSLTHYPHDDTAEIDALELLLKRGDKADWDIASESGWLSSGAARVDLRGKVAMIRQHTPDVPGMRIDSRDMQLDTETHTIETDSGVVISSTSWQARGDRMHGNTATGDLTLQNNVVITYAPPE